MGGKTLSAKIDWQRSTRRCLYVNTINNAHKIIDCQITYPDGFLAVFKTDDMMEEILQNNNQDEELTWDQELES